MKNRLTVAINAQIPPDRSGIGTVLVGLLHALGKLKDGEEEYVLITHPRDPYWPKPFMGDNMRIVSRPWQNWKERLKAVISPFREALIPSMPLFIRPLLEQMQFGRNFHVAKSDGFFESLGVDVIHFPYQSFVISELPCVYNPHDLQHLHLPQFFSGFAVRVRETMYRMGCENSQAVAVHSMWIKDDIIHQYGSDSKKIYVIPWGAPTETYGAISSKHLAKVSKKFNLPRKFVLYPAQTWPHKNHIRLLEAIAILREQKGLVISLVCTGRKNEFWPIIKSKIRQFRLENHVRFLGFIAPEELMALYKLAEFVVIPTLFEAGSAPMFEAWREGTPVACSAVTSLPQDAGDAALLFDPTSAEEIANAIYRMTTNTDLGKALVERGKERLRDFSWARTAKMYRALYRKLGGIALCEADQKLLDEALLWPGKS